MKSPRFLLVLFFIGASHTLAIAATGTPPANFRGFKWGTKPSSSMTKVGGPYGSEKLSVWKNAKRDLPPYLGISITEEAYLFEHNKLYGGQLFIDGSQNFDKAKQVLISQYGQPDFKNERLKIYKWKWRVQKIGVSLTYQANYQRTTIGIEREK